MKDNSNLYAILSYITWIGWLIAFFARDKDSTLVKRHLNQTLILNLIATICTIISRANPPLIIGALCGIVSIAGFVFWVMGLIRAVQASEEPLPIIGGFELIK